MNPKPAIRHLAFLAGIIFPVMIGTTPKLSAQETGRVLVEGELQTRLENLEHELAVEREAFGKAKESAIQRLAERKAERRELAERLLNRKIELEQLKKQRTDFINEEVKQDAALNDLDQTLQRFLVNAESAAEHLHLHLRETPSDQQIIQQVQQVLRGIKNSRDAGKPEASWQSLQTLFSVLERMHREATRLRLARRSLRTADGFLEEVKLLAVGHIAHAYETLDGTRVGLALSSPAEATGHRWTEKVANTVSNELKQAIVQAETGYSGSVTIPMDVTGRLRADDRLHDEALTERLADGGPVMFPLAAVAILALLILIERVWWLYLHNADRTSLAQCAFTSCKEKKYAEAARMIDRSRGTVPRILGACLRRRDHGVRAMEDGIQEQLLQELPRLRRFLAGLAILAAVAPLLGLLGTVTGIIQTFGVIRAFGNANPSLMAGGISEALVTTAAGLVIAIPILLFRGALHSRMEKVLGDAERHAASLLNILARNG